MGKYACKIAATSPVLCNIRMSLQKLVCQIVLLKQELTKWGKCV